MTPLVEPNLASIRARSHRQVMDWSLVLASQGIEAIIEQAPAGGGWLLLVEFQQHERAMAAIRQYRVENRRWAWRQELNWSGLTFHWGALLWVLVLIGFHWLGEAMGDRLENAGRMSGLAVRQGEWWRLFTAVSLHADVGHLASNVSTGVVVLGLAMARYGPGSALLAAFLTGAGGNVAGLLLHEPNYLGLGASGMVCGALGLLAAQSVFLLRHGSLARRPVLSGVLGGSLLFVLEGLNPASDIVAHFGGFLSGLLLGSVLAIVPAKLTQHRTVDHLAAAVAAGLAILTWTLALR